MSDYEVEVYELYGHHTVIVLRIEPLKYVATAHDNKQTYCCEGENPEEALGGCIRMISAADVKRNGGGNAA